MTTTVEFFVPGAPVPYTRMTQGTKWSDRAKRYLGYRADVGWQAKEAGAYQLPGPVRLEITVYVPDRMRRQWDVDNVAKGVADALQGICYHNDRQIVSMTARVYDAAPFGGREGVRVVVEDAA